MGGLDDLIKEYERERMEEEVYCLLPPDWHEEIRVFTEIEFEGIVQFDGKVVKKTSDEISEAFNSDGFNPRDGEIVQQQIAWPPSSRPPRYSEWYQSR